MILNNVRVKCEIGNKTYNFKSKAEYRYACYLEWLRTSTNFEIERWEYEPQEFWFEGIKRGIVSYKPDFKVTNRSKEHYWVEVKGYLDARSKTKLKRFSKYFPDEKLILIDSTWFRRNNSKLKNLVPGWI